MERVRQTRTNKKKPLGIDVLTAARQRIGWVFDTFPKVCVSFSGGKDSSVMLHLVMEQAASRNQKVAVLFVDLEAQYQLTIDHVEEMFDRYADWIEPYWVSLPIILRNAVSYYEPRWLCWDPDRRKDWVRQPSLRSITDESHFPFFRRGMEFEEFIPEFQQWYSQGQLCASLVGIRTDESLNRWRTLTSDKEMFGGVRYTTLAGRDCYSVYLIYDWHVKDIWSYNGRFSLPYNRLYDRMHQAGLTLHQQRICQPYGDDQRKGLWLFHLIEPETWGRVVARVNGANFGAAHARETGNILGVGKITCPDGHTWKSFAEMLLNTMPERTADHYRDKIAVFLRWWQVNGGVDEIPDEEDPKLEASSAGPNRRPSWRRICKVLLKNDYWCKGLSFTQTRADNYEAYKKLMKKRRDQWGIYADTSND